MYADSEYEELESAIGCFARILPIPARAENNFRSDILRQTKDAIREAVAVGIFQPEAIGTDGELINPLSIWVASRAGGFSWRDPVVWSCGSSCAEVVQRESGLELEFHYDAARLERAAVERMAGIIRIFGGSAGESRSSADLAAAVVGERTPAVAGGADNQTAAAYRRSRPA